MEQKCDQTLMPGSCLEQTNKFYKIHISYFFITDQKKQLVNWPSYYRTKKTIG